jgi:hypothetical protein
MANKARFEQQLLEANMNAHCRQAAEVCNSMERIQREEDWRQGYAPRQSSQAPWEEEARRAEEAPAPQAAPAPRRAPARAAAPRRRAAAK